MSNSMENPFYVQKSYISSCFETYKLCSDPLEYSHVDLDETQRVQVVEKKEFDAYYHLWLMKLHNYFVVDPWDTNTVYWFSEKYHVMKGTVSEDGKPKVRKVFESRGPAIYIWARMAGVYASFIFISPHYCLFTSGIGDLFLVHTGNRTSDTEEWKNVLTMCLDKPPEKANSCLKLGYHPTILVDAILASDDQTLKVASMVLTEPVKEKSDPNIKRSNTSSLKFYTVVFSYPISGPDPPDEEEDDELEYKFDLHFALGSEGIPQFMGIVGDYLMVVIDRDLQGSAFEKDKVRESRHYEYGYQDMKQQDNYGWQQTSNEINLVVDVPTDVDKDEIVCKFQKGFFEVGLNDGTTFVKGKTFKELDTDACFWTFNAQHHLVELLMTKEVSHHWKQVFEEPPKPPSSDDSSEDERPARSRRKGNMHYGLRSALRMPRLRRPKPLFFSEFRRRDEGPPPPRKRPILLTIGDRDEDSDCTTLFTLDNKGRCHQRLDINIPVLYSVNLDKHVIPNRCFATPHNDDTVVWTPSVDKNEEAILKQSGDPDKQVVLVSCQHVCTFNALAGIQLSTKDRKYTVCDPILRYVCISDSTSYVKIYYHSSATDATARMYVHKLPHLDPDASTIYGLHASRSGYVMVLRKGTFGVIKTDVDTHFRYDY